MTFASVVFLNGCKTTEPVALEPAKAVLTDVFTCKGLAADGRWLDVTDEFDPENDIRVVVVAQIPEFMRRGLIMFELVDPSGTVAFVEKRNSPPQDHLGIWWDCQRLLERGGEGYWKANISVDEEVIGQARFRLGEPPEEDDFARGRYLMVTTERTTLPQGEWKTGQVDAAGNLIPGATGAGLIPGTTEFLQDLSVDINTNIPSVTETIQQFTIEPALPVANQQIESASTQPATEH